jgi:peroxiredoxin
LLLVAVGAGLVLAQQAVWAEDQSPLVGKAAPDFTAKGLQGEPVALSTLKGSPVVLCLWASWCPDCRKELPVLAEVHNKLKSQGLKVVAVSLDRDEEAMRKFLADNPLPFTVLHLSPDAAKKVTDAYKLTGIPRVLFLDKKGVVKADTTGYHEKAAILGHIQELGVDTSAAK